MTFMIIPQNRTVLDRERVCDRCKTRAAVVIFDRLLVCPVCGLALDKALIKERDRHVPKARAAGQ